MENVYFTSNNRISGIKIVSGLEDFVIEPSEQVL